MKKSDKETDDRPASDESEDRADERRQHRRYEGGSEFLAEFSSTGDCALIVNISRGGIACRFEDEDIMLPDDFSGHFVSLVYNGFVLDSIPVEIVNDYDMIGIPINSANQHCLGLQFGKLTYSQVNLLEHFIRQHIKK